LLQFQFSRWGCKREKKVEQKIDGSEGDKRGRPKKGQKTNSPQEPKKGRELVPLSGRKST
jgi:hypothetical protein